MEIFFSSFQLIQKALFAVGPFVLLLGVLIFIHELGHFLAARYFGVKVEIFSLGFGPKILKYKKGDTLYCLSLFPLGGYVKMFGSNPLEELSEKEKSQAFLYKKVPQKWLIAFAGPFMNLIFTLFVFFLLSEIGIPSLPAHLGDIQKASLAYQAGFRSGDTVLSVNGEPISYYEDLTALIKQKKGGELFFRLKDKEGFIKNLSVPVQKGKNTNPLEWKREMGFIEGLTILSTGLRIGVISESLAYKKGLRTFDEILEVNGASFRYWRDLEDFVKNKETFEIVFKRGSKKQTAFLNVSAGEKLNSLFQLGLEPSFLYIEQVGPDTPAAKAGLMKGDRLISIQNQKVKSWEQVLKQVGDSSGAELKIQYQRKEEIKTAFISPKPLFVEGNIKKRYMLGIVSGALTVVPPEIVRKRSFFKSITYSFSETGKWLSVISVYLIRLIQGEVSIRTMGGPVAIGKIAHSSFHQGLFSFLFGMALISLNLFFLNLLPIPVLDGGYILFFTLEGILGRALSVKKLVLAQQVGLIFVLSFMGMALFNDIYNLLKVW
ncbi:MAG: RIP metalloprotease RseP [Oligoflexia bacterium]|nr:RIP metalloprotease RseP [Oligoflexia bacterium]